MANEVLLIEANELKNHKFCLVDGNDGYRLGWNDAIDAVTENAPTVDAVPVVHGRWEVVHGVLTPGGDPLLRCPICKSRESEHLCGIECRTVWHYCPNCGAKMDGDGNG